MGSCISNIQKSLYYQNYTDVQLNIKSLKKKKKKKPWNHNILACEGRQQEVSWLLILLVLVQMLYGPKHTKALGGFFTVCSWCATFVGMKATPSWKTKSCSPLHIHDSEATAVTIWQYRFYLSHRGITSKLMCHFHKNVIITSVGLLRYLN